MTAFGIRGTFLDFIDDPWRHVGRESEAARFHADGLLVVEDGRITDFGAHDEVAARHAGLAVTTIRDRLILPGFIDGHVHFPQTRVLGAFGEHLLPWLEKWVFPEEIKFKDRAYAREAAGRFFDNLLASGTTTCQAFTTTAPAATEELFDEAARRNMRLIAGLTGIDRLAPPGYASSPEDFYRDSKRLIERYHRQGRGLYAITPRNAHVATPDLMAACERLKREHPDCWVNTHLAETVGECQDMQHPLSRQRRLCRGLREVWAGRAEVLGRPRRVAVRRRVPPPLGQRRGDHLLPVLEPVPRQRPVPPRPRHRSGVARQAVVRHRRRWRQPLLACSTSWTTPTRSAWSTTAGSTIPPRPSATSSRPIAASGRSRWAAPKDFTSTIWSATSPPARKPTSSCSTAMADRSALAWRQSLIAEDGKPSTLEQAADLLFGLMTVGDDRAIEQTWAMGRQVYLRRGSN